MTATLFDLSVVPGTSADWLVTITDAAGAAQTLAQLTAAEMTIQQRLGDTTPLLQLTLGAGITVHNSLGGLLRIQATKEQTALMVHPIKYWAGIQCAFSDGTRSRPDGLFGTITPEPPL